ncbi:MAG: GNAT family N-acetyltransferase [Candidatus Hydrogenedentota bacterium]|nr:MAG: GNAT family N-acetyltransferase [Candidatus Hydrogenedentota bacterium]
MRKTAGVTHLTVFTRPAACGGDCLYCPKVPSLPKSYLPHSNIARHGLDYEAAGQVRYWWEQNRLRGGVGEKLEIIVLGGSFTAHPVEYQRRFLKGIYEAVDGEAPGADLEEVVRRHQESSGPRIIGITIESRPNLLERRHLENLFRWGVTKVEIGVQSLDEDVLEFNERGHGVQAVIDATRMVRDVGLKIGYHILFGMPGSSPEKDIETVRRVFSEAEFLPDHVKFYFCEMFRREFMKPRLVALFESGEWRPATREARVALMKRVIPMVASSTRISRVGRKVAGDEFEGEMIRLDRDRLERSFGCRCVRCREPRLDEDVDSREGRIVEERLSGEEVHLEYRPVGGETCFGLLRLRLLAEEAIVRELHVYGREARRGETTPHQHRGVGKALMAAAEAVASREGRRRVRVSSGIGVRGYYGRLGYRLDESGWMVRPVGGKKKENLREKRIATKT